MRTIYSLSQDWRFRRGSARGAHRVDFPARGWERVAVPHCVKICPTNASGGRNYQGPAWYRKRFRIPAAHRGQKLFLEFEGAMQVADVWLNGKKLCTHHGGYTPFTIDITDRAAFAETNLLAVRVDNSDEFDTPPGKPQGHLDFTYEGGLYRDVQLTAKDRLHITDPGIANEKAGGGIFVTYPSITSRRATVEVKTHVRNEHKKAMEFGLRHALMGPDGDPVAECETPATLAAGCAEHLKAELVVKAPRLWHPHHPHLYRLETELAVDGVVVDRETTRIGLRTIRFDAEKGLYLNGRRIKLPGGNYHQTGLYVGNAWPRSMQWRDARKLREAGFLHIRAAHYLLNKAFMDACDELGLMVTVAAPGWQWYRSGGIFEERAFRNVREIVRRDRNHPCVLFWEPILNESDGAWIDGNHTEMVEIMTPEFQKRVHEITHEEYPVEPCYTASDHGPTDITYVAHAFNKLDYPHVAGVNRKRPYWIREYCGGPPDNWTDQNTPHRCSRAWGEHAMLVQAAGYAARNTGMYGLPRLAGFDLWPAIEHNRGYHANPCYGGALDLYRIPKFSYHFFRSQMDPRVSVPGLDLGPNLYIANWWSFFSPRDVVVFSNCDKVRLFINGKKVAEKGPDRVKLPHPPFTFRDLLRLRPHARSELKAEGLIRGKVAAVHIRHSPGATRRLELVPDSMGRDLVADGADLVMVHCRAVDDLGHVVPHTADSAQVHVSVEGEGRLVGGPENDANPTHLECGEKGFLVQSTTKPGKVTVRARLVHPPRHGRAMMEPGTVSFRTRPAPGASL